MKRWSVTLLFERYGYNHTSTGVTLQKTTTNLAVRLVTGRDEASAFGFAYFDAIKKNSGCVLASYLIVEILPIKRKTKKSKEDE